MGSSRSDSSGSAKERLRWTQELHNRFEEAVNSLGGADSKLQYDFTFIVMHDKEFSFCEKQCKCF